MEELLAITQFRKFQELVATSFGTDDKQQILDSIHSKPFDELFTFMQASYDLFEVVDEEDPKNPEYVLESSFSLVPSEGTCTSVHLNEISSIGTLATFYADTIKFHDPFEYYKLHVKSDSEKFRNDLLDTLMQIFEMEDLFLSGILQISPSRYYVSRIKRDQFVTRDNIDSIFEVYTDKLRKFEDEILEQSYENISVEIVDWGFENFLSIEYPEMYHPHGECIHMFRSDEEYKKLLKTRANQHLTSDEKKSLGLFEHILYSKTDHMFQQYRRSMSLGSSIFANAPIEYEFIRYQKKRSEIERLQKLIHTVPMLEKVHPTQLLELRQKEYGSFLEYRKVVVQVLEQSESLHTPKDIKQISTELLSPSLSAMNQTLIGIEDTILKNVTKGSISVLAGIGKSIISPHDILQHFDTVSTIKEKVQQTIKDLKQYASTKKNHPYFFAYGISKLEIPSSRKWKYHGSTLQHPPADYFRQ